MNSIVPLFFVLLVIATVIGVIIAAAVSISGSRSRSSRPQAERHALGLNADPGGGAGRDELAAEARAIVRTAGWDGAEQYLQNHHRMTRDEAAEFLRGIGPV